MFSASYSPVHAIVGGVLIGLSSLIMYLSTGRSFGISGMFSRLLFPRAGNWVWRLVFFIGLLAGAALAFQFSDAASLHRPARSVVGVIIAGVLVGFGTRLGGGCTSGHGVSGISLGARSSFLATLIFIGAGMITVFLLRQTGGGLSP